MQSQVETGPPPLPHGFWQHPEIQRATLHQHFGYLLRAYRELQTPIIRQSDLAAWLGITQGQLSRIERGSSGGNNLAKLRKWAQALRIPPDVLWFADSASAKPCTEPQRPDIMASVDSQGEDVNRRQLLKRAGIGAVLLGTPTGLSSSTASCDAPVKKIGSREIASLRYWTETFRRADNQYGGGESLDQATHFVRSRLIPMLRDSRYTSDKTRAAMFSAAAELYQLTGWMSYDTGNRAAGRKCLQQALRLCEEAGDTALGAEMLAGMSHQAAFLRAPDEALELALAAKQMAKKVAEPALLAEATVMEAHGLALQGNAKACIATLRDAEGHFARMRAGNRPTWLRYFDQAYMSAKFAHTLRDLGRPTDAECFARQSLDMTEGYERGRMFNTALLAGILADKSEIDEAVSQGQQALRMASKVQSARTVGYMTDVAHRLGRFHKDTRVKSLYKNMAAGRIPLMRIS